MNKEPYKIVSICYTNNAYNPNWVMYYNKSGGYNYLYFRTSEYATPQEALEKLQEKLNVRKFRYEAQAARAKEKRKQNTYSEDEVYVPITIELREENIIAEVTYKTYNKTTTTTFMRHYREGSYTYAPYKDELDAYIRVKKILQRYKAKADERRSKP